MAINILEQVQTYQLSQLALLTNENCFIGTANKDYLQFNKLPANLGDTVTFDLPPRYLSYPTLVANFQGSKQRVHSLTVDQAQNVSYEFSNQQFIFNAREYMDRFGKSAVAELGAYVEANVAENCLTPYRFYGDGTTPINSYGQLAQALANFRNYGAATADTYGYLWDLAVPGIVNSGLNQFVPSRNEAAANSWMLGDFDTCTWTKSNFLPEHTSGTVGENADTLTFVSINAAGDQITFSGVTTNSGAIKKNDLIQFDGDIRYLTFIGHRPSGQKVQVRATADADGTTGTVVVNITPALIATNDNSAKNLTRALTTSDTATALPSHRRGMIASGRALYLAMPQLPEQYPFPTGNEVDPDTKVSMRSYYGSTFGQNQQGFVNDVIWGSSMVGEYGLALIFPL